MSYAIYIDTIRVPVDPEEISTKIKGRNETVELANQEIFTHVKTPDLTEISFDLLLPNHQYSFGKYVNNKYKTSGEYVPGSWYINRWQDLMDNKQPCRLYILRQTRTSRQSYAPAPTYLPVTIESMTVKESADERGDFVVSMTLQEYKDNATKTLTFDSNNQYQITVTRNLLSNEVVDYVTMPCTTDRGWNQLLILAKKYNLTTSGLSQTTAAKKILWANYNTIRDAAKLHFYDWLEKTYKSRSTATLKKKYGREKWNQQMKTIKKRGDYKCWRAFLTDSKTFNAQKLYVSSTYIVKGTELKIPLSLLNRSYE